MTCDYCGGDSHHALCPMTSITADPNRKAAFDMGVPVATSDWVDAAFLAFERAENSRDVLTELFSLHHRYVERLSRPASPVPDAPKPPVKKAKRK